jgi:hypothetical protein
MVSSLTQRTTSSPDKAPPEMNEWGEPEFGVHDSIHCHLLEHVLHRDPQRPVRLQEVAIVQGVRQVIRERGAPEWGDEVPVIVLPRDRGVDPPHRVVAQATVEMAVQLDLGQSFQVHASSLVLAHEMTLDHT